MSSFSTEGIIERLTQLDDDLLALYENRHFEMVIVGGSALAVMNILPDQRFTHDIDVLRIASEIEHLLARFDMNTDVSTFLYQYPEGWESRKIRVPFEGMCLEVFTLSNEDLAITKMLSWRDSDRDDLKGMVAADKIDFVLLENILNDVTEVQVNLNEDEWKQLKERYEVVKG